MKRIGMILVVIFLVIPSVATAQTKPFTADEALYVGRMTAWVEIANESINNVASLARSPDLGNSRWEGELLAEAAVWSAVYRDVQRVRDVPPRFGLVHQHLDAAFSALDQSGVHMRRAIEYDDLDEFRTASLYLDEFTEEINLANRALH